jgi:uncharacterized protein (UPF0264 family)
VQLLVSVRDPAEAHAAVAGGADFVDAKDPAAGALGAVSLEAFRAIVQAVNGARAVTAALGDATDGAPLERDAAAFARAGAALVKVGFGGVDDRARARALLEAAARGAGGERVIAVAYADHRRAGSLPPLDVLDVVRGAGLAGVLLDTADKRGPGLCDLIAPPALAEWVAIARRARLLVALAGRLEAADIESMRSIGADVVGVRGAACSGGRSGQVTAERVRLLKETARAQTAQPQPDRR